MIRDDLSDKLIHFTKGSDEEAADIFLKIINESRLLGGRGYIKGSHCCVCFTESPIGKLAHILANRETYRFTYAPFGVMVDKLWLWDRGGRPVIYQSDQEYKLLHTDQKYRHKIYEPDNDIDFTWEREWRIKTPELDLDPDSTTLIVPSRHWVDWLIGKHTAKVRWDVMAAEELEQGFGQYYVKSYPWHFIALEDLGISL
ncbi:hypothetical protein ACFLVL_03775 [Chloroflexota bacterium]